MPTVILKPGKERSLLRRHPWIFSGALAKGPGGVKPGETVELVSSRGEFLARGAASPHSQIAVRVWSFDQAEEIDREFFRRRLSQSLARRVGLPGLESTTVRLVSAESDGLPGLIVDRYGDFLVAQFLAAGTEFWKETIVGLLGELLPNRGIYERSDAAVRAKEGLPQVKGLLAGEEPPPLVEIEEGGLKFLVDVVNGHKTGFYLDQRENRREVGLFAQGRSVLNCFAYSGGFGLHALAGGATQLTNLEISAPSLALLAENLRLNGLLDDARVENLKGDVFAELRHYHEAGRKFDLIILDPPKFVESQGQLPRGARGYKDINRLAFGLLNSGGLLFTFSCSGLLPADLFQKIVADAALDAGCEARIIKKLGQALDHPIGLNFPEGSYLKGLLCRVD